MQLIRDQRLWKVAGRGPAFQFYALTDEIVGCLAQAQAPGEPLVFVIPGSSYTAAQAGRIEKVATEYPGLWLSDRYGLAEVEDWIPVANPQLLDLNGFCSIRFCQGSSTGVFDSAFVSCISKVRSVLSSETRSYDAEGKIVRWLSKVIASSLDRMPLFDQEGDSKAIRGIWISRAMAREVADGKIRIPYRLTPNQPIREMRG